MKFDDDSRLGPRRRGNNNGNSGWISRPMLVIGMICILGVALYKFEIGKNATSTILGSSSAIDFSKKTLEPVTISTGSHRNIPYYFCKGKRASYEDVVDLVLLHGAKFTKEDWKTSGILEKFCNVRRLSVMAMDLPVNAGHEQLFKMLRTLSNDGYISQIPVALVTPSASGFTVTDWIMNDDIDKLPQLVKYWIPVASGSVKQVPDTKLKDIRKMLPNKEEFSILAIYGNEDKSGKIVSQKLHKLAGAEIVEIKGGHPCYLDSPDEFVATVVNYLGLQLP